MQHLKREIEEAIERWGVPGLGYAVILKGQVILAGGAGVRTIGGSETVNEHTLFAIGSVTKSFTAAAVAMLVDEGLLSWNDRVLDLLPDFRLYDPYVTREPHRTRLAHA